MFPEPWPKDPERDATLVAVLVAEIRLSDPAELDILLTEFLRAAWPTRRAQWQ